MGGRLIKDHSFFAGGPSKESPLPMGDKFKYEASAEGVGELSKYEDTTEAIKSQQMENKKKVNGHKMREGYRQ